MNRIALVALAGLAAAPALATIQYSGGTYSQNFDGLGSTGAQTLTGRGPHALNGVIGTAGLDGWYAANFGGSSTNTEVRAQDGSLAGSAGRGVVSFGTGGSGERALGALATSNQISSFGALFTNDTGGVLTEVTISYTGEQWRRGDVPSPNTLFFSYGLAGSIEGATTAFSALDFVGPNTQAFPTEVALNGNDPANRSFISATISGLNWTPGTTLAIAWAAQDQTGQDDGLAIDDLTFVAVPAPGAAALLGLAGLIGGLRRRR